MGFAHYLQHCTLQLRHLTKQKIYSNRIIRSVDHSDLPKLKTTTDIIVFLMIFRTWQFYIFKYPVHCKKVMFLHSNNHLAHIQQTILVIVKRRTHIWFSLELIVRIFISNNLITTQRNNSFHQDAAKQVQCQLYDILFYHICFRTLIRPCCTKRG